MVSKQLLCLLLVAVLMMHHSVTNGTVLDELAMMEDADVVEADNEYRRGCSNKASKEFCTRFRKMCRPGNKNFHYLSEKCSFSCGLCG